MDKPTFESLRSALSVDGSHRPWSRALHEMLLAHIAAGVDVHPLQERRNDLHDDDLPLHNLFWREMSNNLGGDWPNVLKGMSKSAPLSYNDRMDLINLWRRFWVDFDLLDTDSLLKGTASWNEVVHKSPVARQVWALQEQTLLNNVATAAQTFDRESERPRL